MPLKPAGRCLRWAGGRVGGYGRAGCCGVYQGGLTGCVRSCRTKYSPLPMMMAPPSKV